MTKMMITRTPMIVPMIPLFMTAPFRWGAPWHGNLDHGVLVPVGRAGEVGAERQFVPALRS